MEKLGSGALLNGGTFTTACRFFPEEQTRLFREPDQIIRVAAIGTLQRPYSAAIHKRVPVPYVTGSSAVTGLFHFISSFTSFARTFAVE
jgi:hypothetical protein